MPRGANRARKHRDPHAKPCLIITMVAVIWVLGFIAAAGLLLCIGLPWKRIDLANNPDRAWINYPRIMTNGTEVSVDSGEQMASLWRIKGHADGALKEEKCEFNIRTQSCIQSSCVPEKKLAQLRWDCDITTWFEIVGCDDDISDKLLAPKILLIGSVVLLVLVSMCVTAFGCWAACRPNRSRGVYLPLAIILFLLILIVSVLATSGFFTAMNFFNNPCDAETKEVGNIEGFWVGLVGMIFCWILWFTSCCLICLAFPTRKDKHVDQPDQSDTDTD